MGTSGRTRRFIRGKAIVVMLVLLVVALAACANSSSAPSPTPRPPTIPPVITRIVTPAPTPTPLPPPTPAYDLSSVEGRWYLRADITISSGSLIGELRYSGAADFTVSSDGSAAGTGTFSPAISSPPCDAQVMDSAPLVFAVQSTAFAQGDALGVDLLLVPVDPDEAEHYRLICPNHADVRDIQQPILWPALAALPAQDAGGAALDGLHWRLVLVAGQSHVFSADLAAATGGALDGTLTIELRAGRG